MVMVINRTAVVAELMMVIAELVMVMQKAVVAAAELVVSQHQQHQQRLEHSNLSWQLSKLLIM